MSKMRIGMKYEYNWNKKWYKRHGIKEWEHYINAYKWNGMAII